MENDGYRLFSICLPCLKSAETDEKDSEDCPPGLNPVENGKEEINSLEDEYPEYLNPFTSEEDEGNENPNGKAKKDGHETEYPDSINPFSSEGEENEWEIDYPEELNPFSDEKENEREIDYPEELNPFAHEEDKEANSAIVNQSSLALDHTPPVTNGSSSTFQLPNEEKSNVKEDESEQQRDEYPESLNPFASEDEEIDYPEELNSFADEKDDEAYSARVSQSAATLSNELTPPPSNGSSSKFPLPYEEKSDDEKSETKSDEKTSCPVPSIYKYNEYDEALNPLASEDVENYDIILKNPPITVDPQPTATAVNGSSSLVPLANERKKITKKYRVQSPMTMRIIPSESAPGVNDPPRSQCPFQESCLSVQESMVQLQESMVSSEWSQWSAPGVNGVNESAPGDSGYSSTFQLPNEEKLDDEQKESEQHGDEYPDILNPFASEDEEDDYPKELNPFADEKDDEAYSARVSQSAATLSNELTAPSSNGSSSKFALSNEEKPDDEQDQSEKQEKGYPNNLNPFAIKDIENKQYEKNYPEELNPFADENQSSPKIDDPQQATAAINGSPSLVLLPNERKAKFTTKYRALDPPVIVRITPKEKSAKEASGPVPVAVKVDDYDEALNPFASEDEEATGDNTGNLPSNPAQPTAYSSTSVKVKRKAAKSLKKRRAPDPPVIESTKEGSAISDFKSNQPYAGSSYPATKEVEISEKETCPSTYFQ
ncbi:hypothetical protein JTE90_003471 [Oedothorax gibbosus]|uniref:Uncharacterized protein n=1 Tax=Oedothorax gibbosus TaxID=931172 RepID=A0AAV6U525_9ARAC|nr:hypothetical protein JTE90_003471 [Oedothorax gibbosus]